MAVITIKLDPSPRDLKWFGAVVCLFFFFVGGIVWWRSGSLFAAGVLGAIGVSLAVLYYLLRPIRRPMYVGWMRAVYPIGLVLSHVILGTMYFLLLTPLGAVLRVVRKDPLRRRFEADAPSYWTRRNPEVAELPRYLRQY